LAPGAAFENLPIFNLSFFGRNEYLIAGDGI